MYIKLLEYYKICKYFRIAKPSCFNHDLKKKNKWFSTFQANKTCPNIFTNKSPEHLSHYCSFWKSQNRFQLMDIKNWVFLNLLPNKFIQRNAKWEKMAKFCHLCGKSESFPETLSMNQFWWEFFSVQSDLLWPPNRKGFFQNFSIDWAKAQNPVWKTHRNYF